MSSFCLRLVIASRTSCSLSGVWIVPSNRVRSSTPRRRQRGINGSFGGMNRLYSDTSIGLMPRLISMLSRKPLVVIMPALAPRPVRRMLVASVVPCTRISTWPRNSLTSSL